MDSDVVTPVLKVAGIAGLTILVMYFLYRPLIDLFMAKFPRVGKGQATSIIILFMVLIFATVLVGAVVYLAPGIMDRIYERQIDLVLRNPDNKTLTDRFSFRYKIGDRAFQSGEGQNGIASITGVPWGVKALSIEVSYPGYDQVPQVEPYEINSGIVTVKMTPAKKERPKTTSRNLPQTPTFTDEEMKKFAEVPPVTPSDVIFWRRNLTGRPLDLLLYDCTESQPESVPDQPTADGRLSTWPLPPGQDGKVFEKFKRGNGWFHLWVRDDRDSWPLGLRNLYSERKVYLTVRGTEMKDQPYSADFSPWSNNSDAQLDGGTAGADVDKSSGSAGDNSGQK